MLTFFAMTKYSLSQETIYHGDALKILSSDEIKNNSIDLIIVDPPYNIGKQFGTFKDQWESEQDYVQWCYQWLDLCINKLKSTGTMYVMGSTQAMPYLALYIRSKLTILSRIVWTYDSSGVQAKKYFGSLYEPILHCVKNPKNYTFNIEDILIEAKTGAKRKLIDYRKAIPTPYNTSKVPGNVWDFSRVRYRMDEYENHPSQKPEILLERMIKASSHQGDIILDPFAGTFTTCAVAKKLNRPSIGIELQEEYLKIGLRRLAISSTYKGEQLLSLDKSYNRPKKSSNNNQKVKQLNLDFNGTQIHKDY